MSALSAKNLPGESPLVPLRVVSISVPHTDMGETEMVFALGFNPHVEGQARDKSMKFTPYFDNDSDDESVHPDDKTCCSKVREWPWRRGC
jgi:hypothetical protein